MSGASGTDGHSVTSWGKVQGWPDDPEFGLWRITKDGKLVGYIGLPWACDAVDALMVSSVLVDPDVPNPIPLTNYDS